MLQIMVFVHNPMNVSVCLDGKEIYAINVQPTQDVHKVLKLKEYIPHLG